jgi:hypothetical protein
MDDFAMGRTPVMIVAPGTLIGFEGSMSLMTPRCNMRFDNRQFQHAYTA